MLRLLWANKNNRIDKIADSTIECIQPMVTIKNIRVQV